MLSHIANNILSPSISGVYSPEVDGVGAAVGAGEEIVLVTDGAADIGTTTIAKRGLL